MNVFKLFTGSFHSKEAYRQMRRANNFGMGYALALVATTTLIVMVYYSVVFHRFAFTAHDGQPPLFDSAVTQIADQLPVMTLKDGVLVTKEPKATVIKLSGRALDEEFKDVPIITIDTTGASTSANMQTIILVTSTELISKASNETKIRSLSDFTKDQPNTILINHAVASDAANSLITFVHSHFLELYLIGGGIIWFCIVTFVFIMRIFMLLTLGLIGLIIASITKSRITFAAAVGLASLSYTPVALLDGILLVGFGYAAHTLTLLFAGSVMLYAAIRYSEEPKLPASTL